MSRDSNKQNNPSKDSDEYISLSELNDPYYSNLIASMDYHDELYSYEYDIQYHETPQITKVENSVLIKSPATTVTNEKFTKSNNALSDYSQQKTKIKISTNKVNEARIKLDNTIKRLDKQLVDLETKFQDIKQDPKLKKILGYDEEERQKHDLEKDTLRAKIKRKFTQIKKKFQNLRKKKTLPDAKKISTSLTKNSETKKTFLGNLHSSIKRIKEKWQGRKR